MFAVNFVQSKDRETLIDSTKMYQQSIHAKPRSLQANLDLEKIQKNYKIPEKKLGWDIEKSIFKDIRPENEVFYSECVEYDLNNSKISKIVKNQDELKELKCILVKIYQWFLPGFKYLISR